jgi:hypothetical protein
MGIYLTVKKMIKYFIKKHTLSNKDYSTINFNLTSRTVETQQRRLRTTWTPEMAQDLEAFNNINVETELTALLSQELSSQIDAEILRSLRLDYNTRTRNGFEPLQQLRRHTLGQDNDREGFHFPILPISRRILGRTIGESVVPVQPLDVPRGNLMFLDYVYSPSFRDATIRVDEPTIVNGGWYIKNTFESDIGIKMVLKPHLLNQKPFEIVLTAPDYFTR